MELTVFQVDAFSNEIFRGNPAAIFVLDEWLPELIMQAIAGEMNLSESAFVVRKGNDFRIRWFTPTAEVDLCGHATLASAHVLHQHLSEPLGVLKFHSNSGILTTLSDGNAITLNFPTATLTEVSLDKNIAKMVGGSPKEAYKCDDLILYYDDASEIEVLTPNLSELAKLPYRGICVTAPYNGLSNNSPFDAKASEIDFVCRFFAPAIGINEDPVTGSAYTALTPLYASKMKKTEFRAKQISRRSGELQLQLLESRVEIKGKAITSMQGTLFI